ncbi:MAG: cupin domain-containing protein [Terriglobales bacterium]
MATAVSPIRKEIIFQRAGVEAVRLSIHAGGAVPTHASNVDVAAVVVQGSGRFLVEGKPTALLPGVVVDLKANQSHSIEAQTDLELVVLHYRSSGGEAEVHCGA